MAWEARLGLKRRPSSPAASQMNRLNGLGSPFGFETVKGWPLRALPAAAKWPGKPVWV